MVDFPLVTGTYRYNESSSWCTVPAYTGASRYGATTTAPLRLVWWPERRLRRTRGCPRSRPRTSGSNSTCSRDPSCCTIGRRARRDQTQNGIKGVAGKGVAGKGVGAGARVLSAKTGLGSSSIGSCSGLVSVTTSIAASSARLLSNTAATAAWFFARACFCC